MKCDNEGMRNEWRHDRYTEGKAWGSGVVDFRKSVNKHRGQQRKHKKPVDSSYPTVWCVVNKVVTSNCIMHSQFTSLVYCLILFEWIGENTSNYMFGIQYNQ